MIFNKLDLYREKYLDALLDDETKAEIEAELLDNVRKKYNVECVFVSAVDKENVEELKEILGRNIKEQYVIRYPHQAKQW